MNVIEGERLPWLHSNSGVGPEQSLPTISLGLVETSDDLMSFYVSIGLLLYTLLQFNQYALYTVNTIPT